MDELNNKRTEIDNIDQQLMLLLSKRFDLSIEIGDIKKQENIQVLDGNREQIILDKVSNFSHSPQIKEIYKTIMEQSKSLQRK